MQLSDPMTFEATWRREAATATARRQWRWQRRQMQLPQACTSCEQRYFIDFWRRFAQQTPQLAHESASQCEYVNMNMWNMNMNI